MPDDNNSPNNTQPGLAPQQGTNSQQGFNPVVQELPNTPTPGSQPPPYTNPPNMNVNTAPASSPPNTDFGDNTFGMNSPQATSSIPPVVSQPSPPSGNGKVVGAIIGILFLVVAVGAGILLVQQQQNINEKASTAAAFCGGVNDPNNDLIGQPQCQDNNVCWKATTNNGCLVNGQAEGSLEYFTGMDAWDGNVCYKCVSENGVIVDNPDDTICTPGTKVGGNDALCPGGGGGGGGTTPTEPPYTNGVCGDQCETDSQCQGSSDYNIRVGCRDHKCVNLDCEEAGGTTVPGQLCTCRGVEHSCGEDCGAGIGLCGYGTSCQYLGKSQCSPATRWPICAPPGTETNLLTGPLAGAPQYNGASFESKMCGAGTADPGNHYLWHPEFTNGLTKQQVADLICSGTTPENGGQCTSVRIYDTDWNELTSADLANLQAGTTIRVTVMGTATNGAITQARFTFNGTLRSPVTQKKPNTEEFYDEITIPAGTTNVTVKGEIYNADLGWF